MLRLRSLDSRGRKGNSPKDLGFFVLFDELHAVSAEPFHGGNLSHHTGGDLRAARMPDDEGSSDRQIAMQLNRRSMFIQVGRLRLHTEAGVPSIFAGKPNDRTQWHSIAAAFADGASGGCTAGKWS